VGHQRGQLGFDLRLGERVGDALVGAERRVPHAPGGGVGGGAGQRVAGDAHAQRRAGDPLRVEAVEHLSEPRALLADQCLGGHAYVVEVQHELLVRQQDVDGQRAADEPGASLGTTNSDSSGESSGPRPLRATTSSAAASSTPEM
jgi:hypothetical protein